MAFYQPILEHLWQGRIDGNEPDLLRWHQVMHRLDLQDDLPELPAGCRAIALIGFCCDEGVRRNEGRVGARNGPDSIRNQCRNFPWMSQQIWLADAGNVVCDDGDLESAQQLLGEKIALLSAGGYFVVVLGGGHEVAYGHFLGYAHQLSGKEFGILNFDAHFDLRPVTKAGGANSGTGIWQMNEFCKQNSAGFHYLAMGIQPYSNTLRLFEAVKEMDAAFFLADEITIDQQDRLMHYLNWVIGNVDKLQLTIDMDVFSAANAPGVSAQSVNGIAPDRVFKHIVKHLVCCGKLTGVDIAETNPLYDIDDRTAKLAASLIFDIVSALCGEGFTRYTGEHIRVA